ncbi:glutathione S-transferase family protein [Marinomonas sp. 2405UD68-3]|uniref:glutathione S-transferase family protein n=1 Tax=Marinomonas sp. 2405UD68-3 TaxID=3391835 RepID=UPI0039C97CEE
MTVEIYGPSFSNFVRSIIIACEEKGIPYILKRFDMKSAEHYQHHPFGKFPWIKHGDFILYETAAIISYLDGCFPPAALTPNNVQSLALMQQNNSAISTYIDQAIIRLYALEFAFPKGENGQVRMDKVEQVLPRLYKAMDFLNTMLTENRYISGGNFTVSDCLLVPMVHYVSVLPHAVDIFEARPALKAYLQRVLERPSVNKSIS